MPYCKNGAQCLIMPFAPDPSRVYYVTAGPKNLRYLILNKMVHYGVDGEMKDGLSFDVISPGDGYVMAAGIESRPKDPKKAGLWGCVSINLEKLYHPNTGTICVDNFQTYHMYQLYVKPGKKVFQGDKIGRVLGRLEDQQNVYLGGHHSHFQFKYALDALEYATSKQVAGGVYIHNCKKDTTVNPNTLLYLAPGQNVMLHPLATCATSKDVITRRVS